MQMGVILPTTKLFGGVKRFVELGNIFVRRGHSFTILSPEGIPPEWADYRGKTDLIGNIGKCAFDVLFITENEYAHVLSASRARMKVFYCVSESQAARLKHVLRDRSIVIFVNSKGMFELVRRKYGIDPVKAIGGVDSLLFHPLEIKESSGVVTILAYGRLSRRGKGTQLVVKACEHLHRRGAKIRLIMFDTSVDEQARKQIADFTCNVPFEFIVDHPVRENYKIFQKGDIFVSAERKAGWSNTCAEAMASGLVVVGTKAGTRDFLEHNVTGLVIFRHWWFIARALKRLLNSSDLRSGLAGKGLERIRRFTWEALAERILGVVVERLGDGPCKAGN